MICVYFCKKMFFFLLHGAHKTMIKVAALISGLPALPQNEAGELRAMTAMVAI